MQDGSNNCDIKLGVLVPWRSSCGLWLEESISWPGGIWEVSHGPATQEPAALSGCGFKWVPQGILGSQPGRSCVRLCEEPSGSSIKISLVGNWEPMGKIKLAVIRLFIFWCSNFQIMKKWSLKLFDPLFCYYLTKYFPWHTLLGKTQGVQGCLGGKSAISVHQERGLVFSQEPEFIKGVIVQ